jgi:hypothetical protein
MANEGGDWIMHGMAWDDPFRIRTWRELINWINEVGFLPLFKNEIPGFSVEEHTSDLFWWTGDPEQDPWEWREIIARTEEVAYGKFFGGKSGFVSKEWFPVLANYRRDGYDFDARWDDELANIRHKKIMDCYPEEINNTYITEYTGLELKRRAGFGKDGYKNFNGIITELQMQTYLTIRDFRRKKNKKGQEYGMSVSIYVRPEELWGYDYIAGGYAEDPEVSGRRIYEQVRRLFPGGNEKQLQRLLR